jgi:hypothetical protein
MVDAPLRLQKAVQPEACTTGCITTDHRSAFRQTQASRGLGDVLEQTPLVARCDSALTRLLTRPSLWPAASRPSRGSCGRLQA